MVNECQVCCSEIPEGDQVADEKLGILCRECGDKKTIFDLASKYIDEEVDWLCLCLILDWEPNPDEE